MRRLALLLSIIAVPLALAPSAGANTIQTTVTQVDFQVADTSMCGFQLDFRLVGTFKETFFFDQDGTLLKEIVTVTRGGVTATLTNPANGKIATTQSQAFQVIVTFNPDGSVKTITRNGPQSNFVLPGAGNIFADVGRVVFDADGNIVFEAGPHEFLHGDVASLCAAMADP
jgi:hypothetical protein